MIDHENILANAKMALQAAEELARPKLEAALAKAERKYQYSVALCEGNKKAAILKAQLVFDDSTRQERHNLDTAMTNAKEYLKGQGAIL